jgi:hypothetical protein
VDQVGRLLLVGPGRAGRFAPSVRAVVPGQDARDGALGGAVLPGAFRLAWMDVESWFAWNGGAPWQPA